MGNSQAGRRVEAGRTFLHIEAPAAKLPHCQSDFIYQFVQRGAAGILVALVLGADHIGPGGLVDVPV